MADQVVLPGPRIQVIPYQSVIPSADRDFTVFDGYIGDQGFIYWDEQNAVTQVRALQPVRSDVGNNPWEIRPDSGDDFSQGDFSHGSQQLYFHRPGRDEKRYLYSEGFDVLTQPANPIHLHEMVQAFGSSTVVKFSVADGKLFVADGLVVKRKDTNWPGTWTSEDPYAGEPADTQIFSMTSSGPELYVALGARGIHRRDDVTGTWSHISDIAATRIAWVKDRLVAGDGRNLYEVPLDTTYQPAVLDALPKGWSIENIFEAGAYIYACCIHKGSQRSQVNHYGLSQSNAALPGLEKKGSTPMPMGQLAYRGIGYLNLIYIGCGRANADGGWDPVVYQAVSDGSGFLQFAKLIDDTHRHIHPGTETADLSVKALRELGETVGFGWSTGFASDFGMRVGIAEHHLGRDAIQFSYKQEDPTVAQPILDMIRFDGRFCFIVGGDGVYYQDVDHYVTEAQLVSSIADWNNAGYKTWDRVEISHGPLPFDTRVLVEYTSIDPTEGNWQTALNSDVEGDQGSAAIISVKARKLALRITSVASDDQTIAPAIRNFTVRSYPAPDQTEYRLTRYIRLLSQDRKDELGERIYSDPDALRRQLLGLVYSRITLYEPGATWSGRVDNVQDVQPGFSILNSTGGDPERDGYIVSISMTATLV